MAPKRHDVRGIRDESIAAGLLAIRTFKRHADDEVALSTEAMEQRLESREQRHEKRRSLPGSSQAQGGDEFGVEESGFASAGKGLVRRTRTVQRQFERWRSMGKLHLPKGFGCGGRGL